MITLYLQKKRKSRWPGFWVGVLLGVIAMALMDITDFHVQTCAGECDGNRFSLWDLVEPDAPKKSDRLALPEQD